MMILSDHPRVCGEQSGRIFGLRESRGSPPRVRGTALPSISPIFDHGITPACAGNRFMSSSVSVGGWDHPRVCGEQ